MTYQMPVQCTPQENNIFIWTGGAPNRLTNEANSFSKYTLITFQMQKFV
jgi:hypothetical protein